MGAAGRSTFSRKDTRLRLEGEFPLQGVCPFARGCGKPCSQAEVCIHQTPCAVCVWFFMDCVMIFDPPSVSTKKPGNLANTARKWSQVRHIGTPATAKRVTTMDGCQVPSAPRRAVRGGVRGQCGPRCPSWHGNKRCRMPHGRPLGFRGQGPQLRPLANVTYKCGNV